MSTMYISDVIETVEVVKFTNFVKSTNQQTSQRPTCRQHTDLPTYQPIKNPRAITPIYLVQTSFAEVY